MSTSTIQATGVWLHLYLFLEKLLAWAANVLTLFFPSMTRGMSSENFRDEEVVEDDTKSDSDSLDTVTFTAVNHSQERQEIHYHDGVNNDEDIHHDNHNNSASVLSAENTTIFRYCHCDPPRFSLIFATQLQCDDDDIPLRNNHSKFTGQVSTPQMQQQHHHQQRRAQLQDSNDRSICPPVMYLDAAYLEEVNDVMTEKKVAPSSLSFVCEYDNEHATVTLAMRPKGSEEEIGPGYFENHPHVLLKS